MNRISPIIRASYEVLRAAPGASPDELKKSFHKLALLYHPDRNPDPVALAQFRRVTEAYELLNDTAKVAALNKKYLRDRLGQTVFDDLNITFGTFFGYRQFHVKKTTANQRIDHRLLNSGDTALETEVRKELGTAKPGEGREGENVLIHGEQIWLPIEENNSILDDPAYDAIEVIYAGRMNEDDEQVLQGEFATGRLLHLPWVIINNRGIFDFLEGDISAAAKSYRELCLRVPNNIIFTYRLAVCLLIEGFRDPVPGFLGRLRPDPKKINEALLLLRRCIALGEIRPFGRQRCFAIRKTLADILEKLGHKRQSRSIWKQILDSDPKCAEAIYKLKGFAKARPLIIQKQLKERQKSDRKSETHYKALPSRQRR